MKDVSIMYGYFVWVFDSCEAAAATTSNIDMNYIFFKFLDDSCDYDCDGNVIKFDDAYLGWNTLTTLIILFESACVSAWCPLDCVNSDKVDD